MRRKRWKSIVTNQDGKIEPAFTTALIVALIGVVIGKYSGTKVFVFELRSGIIRLVVGLLSVLYMYLWWGMRLFQSFSFGECGTSVITYSFLACSIMALVLIPLGIIQILGAIIKRKPKKIL